MPTAVLRRYTPPTCTLEITAAGSALSRWTDRTVLKNLRFQLSFDDPKLPPEHQIVVHGDRPQLEALLEVVGNYVQNLIAAAPEQFPWEAGLRPGVISTSETGSPEAQLGLALQPKGLLSHDLQLGNLATAESGGTVHLTTLQLFDLANALEEYSAEAMSLPASSQTPWLTKLPKGWASIAAVTVLALGATAGMAKFVLDVSRPTVQTAAAPRERQVNSELNSDLFPTLSPPPVEASPSITLQPLPPPPPSGATRSNSPGLPPIGVTKAPRPQMPSTAPLQATNSQVTVIDPNAPLPSSAIATAPAESLAQSGRVQSSSTGVSAPPRLTSIDGVSGAASASLAPASDSGGNSSTSSDSSTSSSSSSNIATASTAFDTIPQVAEIRSYFQQKWQPPDGLTQTLEYRLLLNSNGSLQRIVPLGQASENYLDRTNMPLMGEPFVSPTRNGSTPQIRLVLRPDGKVQSFLEYAK
jgi:hypothetical protein